MSTIEIYLTPYCPYCVKALELLDSKKVSYQKIDVYNAPEKKQEMITRSGKHTVPQIFINNISIGGCDDLYALNDLEKLDKLLSKN